MRPEEAARKAKTHVDPPWDAQRAARVQERVFEELKGEPARRNPGRTFMAVAAAACVAVVLALAVWGPWRHRGQLDFADGSCVEPAGDAQVVPVLISDTRIEIEQKHGTVSYDVSKRPGRVFLVHAGAVSIQVLGTSFMVRRADQKVEVQVERGQVRVSRGRHTVLLADGEQVMLDDAQIPKTNESAAGLPEAMKSAFTDGAGGAPEPDTEIDVEALPTVPTGGPVETPSASELFRKADDARAGGNPVAAIASLQKLIRLHPRDPRVTMARFTIGRLHMKQGQPARASAFFEACGAALGGEAVAEASLARSAAGQPAQASALAQRYVDRFPNGPRVEEMRKLAGK